MCKLYWSHIHLNCLYCMQMILFFSVSFYRIYFYLESDPTAVDNESDLLILHDYRQATSCSSGETLTHTYTQRHSSSASAGSPLVSELLFLRGHRRSG